MILHIVRLTVLFMALLATAAPMTHAQVPPPLQQIGVDEHLGEALPLATRFTDHTGREVELSEYFDGTRPVLITLNYYGCPMLCGLQLNALVESLRQIDWAPGENYRLLTLSFDADETSELAAEKRTNYLDALGRGDVDWTFLTGSQESIDALTTALGYRYQYVPASDEYAHPSVLMFASPDGRIMRYLYGLGYDPQHVRLALLESAEGRIGTTIDRIILGCFMYDPNSQSYVKNAFLMMQIGALTCFLLLVVLLTLLWRTDRRRSRKVMD
jgi:protein SCO1